MHLRYIDDILPHVTSQPDSCVFCFYIKRSFRVGWNGLCALASVNHLHFHAYYLDYQLRIETEVWKNLYHSSFNIFTFMPASKYSQIEIWQLLETVLCMAYPAFSSTKQN